MLLANECNAQKFQLYVTDPKTCIFIENSDLYVVRILIQVRSRGNPAGIATRLRAGQLTNCVSNPSRVRDFSLLFNVQTGSEAHPASCPGRGGGEKQPSAIRLHLVPGIRMNGVVPPFSLVP